MRIKCHIIQVPVALLCITNIVFSQQVKDTIYFDYNWSICEKPVAEYYRVCTLNKVDNIFYKGNVADYYIDGTTEMTGTYTNKGFKEGVFTFYNRNGNISKRGNFVNDIMNGVWEFYNNEGKLMGEFNCKNNIDITPHLIISETGDTALKNGNGKFVFDTKINLPGIFPDGHDYKVSGEVKNGSYNGVITYKTTVANKELTSTETYNNGKFKSAIQENFYNIEQTTFYPLYLLKIAPTNLDAIDKFYHFNLLFGYDEGGLEKLINFLLNKEVPEIAAEAKTYDENINDICRIISKVMAKDLLESFEQGKYRPTFTISRSGFVSEITFEDGVYSYCTFKTSSDISKPVRIVNCDVTVTLDTSGYIINSSFKGNINPKEVNEMNYYFSRLAPLQPLVQNGEKILSNINLNLYTVTDTLKAAVDTISYYYLAASSNVPDSIKYSYSKKEGNKIREHVQVEAKFPGGVSAWQKYLERNLNSDVAISNRAPNGYYTVVVSFLVDKEGNISEVKALNNPGYGTAEEAVRVIQKGPKWVPAIQDGKNVIYRQKQSITFMVSGG